MEKIEVMSYGHTLWNRTIKYAEACSWGAGRTLADIMRKNAFDSNEKVIVALHDNDIAGFCTLSNRDELSPEYDFKPFVGFVFVDEKFRGNRLSEKLISAACETARTQGFTKIFIMSGEIGLYEKYGFRKIGDYKTLYDSVEQLFSKDL